MRAKAFVVLESLFLGLGLLVLTPSVNPTVSGSASTTYPFAYMPAEGGTTSQQVDLVSTHSVSRPLPSGRPETEREAAAGGRGADHEGATGNFSGRANVSGHGGPPHARLRWAGATEPLPAAMPAAMCTAARMR
jgi:hypothetical protein